MPDWGQTVWGPQTVPQKALPKGALMVLWGRLGSDGAQMGPCSRWGAQGPSVAISGRAEASGALLIPLGPSRCPLGPSDGAL